MKYCSTCSEPAQNTMVMCAQCGARSFSDMPHVTPASASPPEVIDDQIQPVNTGNINTLPPKFNGNASGVGVVPEGWLASPPTPWRRYAARMLDITFFGYLGFAVIGFVYYAVAPYSADKFFSIFSGPGGTVLDLVITALVGCVLSGAVIGLSGSSLGKLLFGLMVVDNNGNKIGAVQGMQRDIAVYLRGLGLSIPLVSLFTLWIAYSKLKETGSTSWDTDKNCVVWHRPSGPGQYLLNVIGIFILILLNVAARVLNAM